MSNIHSSALEGNRPSVWLFLVALTLFACRPAIPEDIETAMQALPEKLDFNLHVKPVLSDRCFSCHGPDKNKRKAGLRLDLPESALAELPEDPGKYAIRPGKLAASQLFHRITNSDPELLMPPAESELSLSAREKAILIRWIEQGAGYQPHWAFINPQMPQLPDPGVHPIDYFVRKKLEPNGWQPAAEAGRETLLRRLRFDLTGLPPTLEEMNAFLTDTSENAYEKAVDGLLASPHYGERMATDWMDVARFADTHGYTVDRYRDMSPWRDWVISAFNENMPYDQFVTWQLAGDLLPNATKEQILATGFNRNHKQNMEGGIVEEEFRVEYVADRTNTLGTTFLGLTMECARCHDHKYDPISQKNYYELYSFFNNVKEAGQISWDDAAPVPTLLLTEERTDSILAFLHDNIRKAEEETEMIEKEAEAGFLSWLKEDHPAPPPPAFPAGQLAHFTLNGPPLVNRIHPGQYAELKQQDVSAAIDPVFDKRNKMTGLLLDGDAWLDLSPLAAFDRHQPFSIGIRVNLPDSLTNGVLFHKSIGAALYNFRGFHLALKNNRLEMLMAHTAPYNAIVEYAGEVPRKEWIHLAMTYDGSGSAGGLKLYLNGKELPTTIEQDELYKSILFKFTRQEEPGLQIGARWRGTGIKGALVNDITVFERELSSPEILFLADQEQFRQLLQKPAEQLSREEKSGLKSFYVHCRLPQHREKRLALQAARRKYNQTVDTIREVMVMQEMETNRPAFILRRGQYDQPAEPVLPNTPESLLPFPDSLPKNRLGLARWLFHPDHPLTARVAVNRLWQQFFGRGLVATPEDFGNQGQLPSHPELLDWLALSFRNSGWDIKKMVKEIVLSATYRQSSRASPEIIAGDPQNLLLARGPSMRLTAEMLRDNVLAASGLLVMEVGGPSVKPYQPEGLWRINGATYRQEEGDGLYRRSMYTFWKRTIPHPSQATFDAPTRDNCSVRRQKTNTPLQALVLLNDPIYLEAARMIGQDITRMDDEQEGIRAAFRRLTGRRPADGELQLLAELRQSEWEKFSAHPEKIKGWLEAGDYPVNKELDPAWLAANSVLASTIINADATIFKR